MNKKKPKIGEYIEGIIMMCFSISLIFAMIWCIIFTVKSFIKPKQTITETTSVNETAKPSEQVSKPENKMKVNVKISKEEVPEQKNIITFDNLSETDVSDMKSTLDSISVWLGDSRTVGIQNTTNSGICIAKQSMSYSWFKSDAVPNLKKILTDNPYKIVIINFGVNDCASHYNDISNIANDYSNDINDLISEYPDTEFYYLSVNPVNNNYDNTEQMNITIFTFNETIQNNCNATFIDSNTFMLENGFESADGLHYSEKTNMEIYDFITKSLACIKLNE